jgi:penicillin-binding protein 1C
LDKDKKYRVNAGCMEPTEMKHVSWFVLPPLIEKYYKSNNPAYKLLPDYRCDCEQEESKDKSLVLVYPRRNSKIFLPHTFEGTVGKMVAEAAHRIPGSRLFWHLDEEYLGVTEEIHQLEMKPEKGKHKLFVSDENGRTAGVSFEIIGEEED